MTTCTDEELLEERYRLITDRIRQSIGEDALGEPLLSFFDCCSEFIVFLSTILDRSLSGGIGKMSVDELARENHRLYEDILPSNYDKSYANPEYTYSVFDSANVPDAQKMARSLSFLYAEVRGLIPYAFEGDKEIFTLVLELYMQIYTAFRLCAADDFYPEADDIRKMIYWFEHDNCEIIIPRNVAYKIDPANDFLRRIVCEEDLSDDRFLYLSGEYVTDDEIATAHFLNTLSEDDIKAMAHTFTEGYRIGFVKAGKPLDKKTSVNIRYSLGFERVVRAAVEEFGKMGLESVIYRTGSLSLTGSGPRKIGFYGAVPNKQYDYDHKDDIALYLDADLVTRRLEVLEAGYKDRKSLANGHAGPAVIEVFGEPPFAPVVKDNAIHHSDKTQKLSLEYTAKASQIINRYIIGEERSFTIIAYPMPVIGKDYEKIFADTVKLNNLPYDKYERIQQHIIDALDTADYVEIKGRGDNRTDIRVSLHPVTDPAHQTKFENCVADVNIPVGEVFTSPRLTGTNGVLHVTKVYLNTLLYNDLEITFSDGMISNYSCANYDDEAQNRKYIKDNLMFKHDTIPLGEFAIGTNTTAYRMARDYNIEGLMPILIGEKTGPHFAVGDTCYSHEEDVVVYNPDGKEIIARENEVSAKRKENEEEAYFQCHTDITIPYDELGYIRAVNDEGYISIIEDGRFVLPGTEELNEPLEGMNIN